MEECIFCKIVRKEIPADIVYEDDEILVFNDIKPVTPIHMLVIPKKHIESIVDIEDLDKELMGKICLKIKEVAKLKKIDENGFRVVVNCGENGGQMVKHLHFHILAGKKLSDKIV